MIVVLIVTVICALFAIHASRMLAAILWLAAVSVLTSLILYLAGAWMFAVIELSVGTGLATVLMVFVITMIGDEHETIPLRRLPLTFVILSVTMIAVLAIPALPTAKTEPQEAIHVVLWQERGLDMLPQIALIFAGMIGVLGLLGEGERTNSQQLENNENHQHEPLQPELDRFIEQEVA